jgi:hypothetical protein
MRFCAASESWLRRFVGWRLQTLPSQAPGALEIHPELSRGKTQSRLYLVRGSSLYGGAEAVARTLALRPIGRWHCCITSRHCDEYSMRFTAGSHGIATEYSGALSVVAKTESASWKTPLKVNQTFR